MTSSTPDIIDLLAGIDAGSPVDRIRAERPETRLNAQKSYLALFEPVDESEVTRSERLAIAAFVAGLHASANVAEFYASGLVDAAGGASLAAAVKAEAEKNRTNGPYGHYPAGPLSGENRDGLHYKVADFSHAVLGTKLSAALEHSHLLVFRPRDANPAALQKLLDAGWTTSAIVTISQIVAFLSFQIRVITGLRVLAASATQPAATHAAE
ncbi:MAG: CMD domain protein [Rhizobiaceae bacterium]|nr:CMD domain protein [Rhizobiaceae bacterium]